MLKPLKSAKTAKNLLHSYIPTFLHSYVATLSHCYIPTFLHSYIPTLLHSYIPSFHHSTIPSFLISLIIKSHNLFGGDGQTHKQAHKQELWYLDRVPSSCDFVKIPHTVDIESLEMSHVTCHLTPQPHSQTLPLLAPPLSTLRLNSTIKALCLNLILD